MSSPKTPFMSRSVFARPTLRAVNDCSLRRARGGVNGVNSGVTTIARRREDLQQMKGQLQTLDNAEGHVRREYANELKKYLTQVEPFSGENLNLMFKKDELARAEKVLERITERQIALKTEKSVPSRVVLLQEATVPTAPVEFLPDKKMALAGLIGLGLPYAAGMLVLLLWNRES